MPDNPDAALDALLPSHSHGGNVLAIHALHAPGTGELESRFVALSSQPPPPGDLVLGRHSPAPIVFCSGGQHRCRLPEPRRSPSHSGTDGRATLFPPRAVRVGRADVADADTHASETHGSQQSWNAPIPPTMCSTPPMRAQTLLVDISLGRECVVTLSGHEAERHFRACHFQGEEACEWRSLHQMSACGRAMAFRELFPDLVEVQDGLTRVGTQSLRLNKLLGQDHWPVYFSLRQEVPGGGDGKCSCWSEVLRGMHLNLAAGVGPSWDSWRERWSVVKSSIESAAYEACRLGDWSTALSLKLRHCVPGKVVQGISSTQGLASLIVFAKDKVLREAAQLAERVGVEHEDLSDLPKPQDNAWHCRMYALWRKKRLLAHPTLLSDSLVPSCPALEFQMLRNHWQVVPSKCVLIRSQMLWAWTDSRMCLPLCHNFPELLFSLTQ
eukprot:702937-Amphidinium_carterae.1